MGGPTQDTAPAQDTIRDVDDRLFGPAIDKAGELIATVAGSWEFWFIMLVTWAGVHFLKKWWSHLPDFRRHRLNELASILIAAALTAWVFRGHERVVTFAIAAGFLNTYVYRIVIGALEKYRPGWIEWLKPRHKQSTQDGSKK